MKEFKTIYVKEGEERKRLLRLGMERIPVLSKYSGLVEKFTQALPEYSVELSQEDMSLHILDGKRAVKLLLCTSVASKENFPLVIQAIRDTFREGKEC